MWHTLSPSPSPDPLIAATAGCPDDDAPPLPSADAVDAGLPTSLVRSNTPSSKSADVVRDSVVIIAVKAAAESLGDELVIFSSEGDRDDMESSPVLVQTTIPSAEDDDTTTTPF